MNRISTIKAVGVIIVLASGWAIVANRLINSFLAHAEPGYINLFRILHNSLLVTAVFTTMYMVINKQRKRLKAAGEHYGRLFENIPAPMFIYDAATYKFLATNKAAGLQYGYTKEEFLTLSPANLRLKGKLKSLYDVSERFAEKEFQSAYWLHGDKFGGTFYVCVYTCDTVFNGKPAKQAMVFNIDEKVNAGLAVNEKAFTPDKLTPELKNNSILHMV